MIAIPLRFRLALADDVPLPGSFFRRGRSRGKRHQAVLYCRRCGRLLLLRRNRPAHECRECRRMTGRLQAPGTRLKEGT